MRNGNDRSKEAEAFLSAHPDIGMVDLLLPDLNGALRGKQLTRDALGKLYGEGLRVPGSIYLMDRGGANIPTLPYGITDGDPDCFCFAAPGSLRPVPWARRPTGQVLASMRDPDGAPHFADPRQVLRRAAAPLGDMGLTPVIALELEFYLLDQARGADGRPRVAIAPETGDRAADIQVYGIEEVCDFETLLGDIHGACAAQGIPADTIVSECDAVHGQIPLEDYDRYLRTA